MKQVHYRAAGGVVLDDDGRVLLIERHVERDGESVHEVRLPKGHVETGETDEQAALREVAEETGYRGTEIAADLGQHTIEYERVKNGKRQQVTRDDVFFLMRLVDPTFHGQDMKPGSEEALFEPCWVDDLPAAEALLTFESEKVFIRRAMQAWPPPPTGEG